MNTQTGTVIEIAGLCGAGKSTVVQALKSKTGNFSTGFSVWQNSRNDIARAFVPSVSAVVRRAASASHVNLNYAKEILRLETLRRRVERARINDRTILIDEGVVFALAKDRFEHQFHGTAFENGLVEQWAGILNAVVWLDASDEVLATRICERSKAHRMKERSFSEISDFLWRYREAYESVLLKFKYDANVSVFRIDTEKFSAEEVADEIVGLFYPRRACQSPRFDKRKSELSYV